MAAGWLTVLAFLFAAPAPAVATPVAIGTFSFDVLIDPTVHLTNDSAIAFASFTVSLESDLTGPSGTSTDIRDLAANETLLSFSGNQWLAGGFSDVDPAFVLTPLRVRLSSFAYGAAGAITYSFDGGASFVADPVLDLLSADTALGIFFEAQAPTDPTAVPEPATLALLASGVAALGARRRALRR